MNSRTLTHLVPNMIVMFGGEECVVTMVNDCRALIVPKNKKLKIVNPKTGRDAGKTLVYESRRGGISIDPNSDLPIVGFQKAEF